MAEVEEAEFWLPSDILNDNKEKLNKNEQQLSTTTEFSFPTEFPYEFHDEDQLTQLTRPQPIIPSQQNFQLKSWVLSGSPQSTLVQFGLGRNHNKPSLVTSPATRPFDGNNDGLDLIYHVAKLKMNDRDNRVLVGSQYRHSPLKNAGSAFCSTYVQQAQQRYGVWSNEQVKSEKSINGQVGSMFLDENAHVGGVKRKCVGTGVFLPRRYVTNPPPMNPHGCCSSARLPPRLVRARALAQAQNNNNVNHFNCGLVQSHCQRFIDYDKLMMARREEAWLLQQRGNLLRLLHESSYY